MDWWKKLKEKHKKFMENQERKDIDFIKQYPRKWRGYTVFFSLVYVVISVVGIIIEPSFIVMVLVLAVACYIGVKEMNKTYDKAMKEIEDGRSGGS